MRRKPDVALVDLALPGMSGAELTRSLLEQDPELRIILYTGAADERQLLEGLDAGAAGLALKSGDPAELEQAILTVAGGERLPGPAPRAAARQGRKRTPAESSPRASARSSGCSRRACPGRRRRSSSFLSSETVRTHVRNAMSKLGAATRAHAVALALQRGEISL